MYICVCMCVCSSEEWQKIVKSDREKIGLTFDNDGEFWSVLFSFFSAPYQQQLVKSYKLQKADYDTEYVSLVRKLMNMFIRQQGRDKTDRDRLYTVG